MGAVGAMGAMRTRGSAADGGECEECEGQGIPDSGRARVRGSECKTGRTTGGGGRWQLDSIVCQQMDRCIRDRSG